MILNYEQACKYITYTSRCHDQHKNTYNKLPKVTKK